MTSRFCLVFLIFPSYCRSRFFLSSGYASLARALFMRFLNFLFLNFHESVLRTSRYFSANNVFVIFYLMISRNFCHRNFYLSRLISLCNISNIFPFFSVKVICISALQTITTTVIYFHYHASLRIAKMFIFNFIKMIPILSETLYYH